MLPQHAPSTESRRPVAVILLCTVAALGLVSIRVVTADSPAARPAGWVYVDGDIVAVGGPIDGERIEALKERFGERFLYFRRSDAAHVVRDAAFLDLVAVQLHVGPAAASADAARVEAQLQAELAVARSRLDQQARAALEAHQRELELERASQEKARETIELEAEELARRDALLARELTEETARSQQQFDRLLDEALARKLAEPAR